MRKIYVPIMHCEKMAVTSMLFRQRAVTEFLVKEGNSAGVIYEQFPETKQQSMEWHQTKNISLDRQSCGSVFYDNEEFTLFDFFGKNANDQCSSLRSDAQQTLSCAS
jgi:hypothetical protein